MHTDKTKGHNPPPYPCTSVVSVVKFFMSDSFDLVAGNVRAAVFPFVTGLLNSLGASPRFVGRFQQRAPTRRLKNENRRKSGLKDNSKTGVECLDLWFGGAKLLELGGRNSRPGFATEKVNSSFKLNHRSRFSTIRCD